MANKQIKHKKTKFEVVDEKLEKLIETLFLPIFQGLKLVFKIIAFIFWRNKYSKRYWEKRHEWRRQMLKLRSKAQKEIILSTMLPLLEKQGFQSLPDLSSWGWDRSLKGYEYVLGRLIENELQKIRIWTQYGSRYFYFRIEVFELKPMIKDISELPIYDPFIFFPESNYANVQEQFKLYKFKNFRSEKVLRKKVECITQRIEKDFSNMDRLYTKCRKRITPAVIDLMQKKMDREKENLKTIE